MMEPAGALKRALGLILVQGNESLRPQCGEDINIPAVCAPNNHEPRIWFKKRIEQIVSGKKKKQKQTLLNHCRALRQAITKFLIPVMQLLEPTESSRVSGVLKWRLRRCGKDKLDEDEKRQACREHRDQPRMHGLCNPCRFTQVLFTHAIE